VIFPIRSPESKPSATASHMARLSISGTVHDFSSQYLVLMVNTISRHTGRTARFDLSSSYTLASAVFLLTAARPLDTIASAKNPVGIPSISRIKDYTSD
jgi:hypothetical protein